ncbi:MAG: hypothetical protein JWQ38_231 [Flavipsychrobacter sp.]|nr:hypothetical protein [Flavipsychrobacter sp.]
MFALQQPHYHYIFGHAIAHQALADNAFYLAAQAGGYGCAALVGWDKVYFYLIQVQLIEKK